MIHATHLALNKYYASRLLENNEGNRWVDPSNSSPSEVLEQDDAIFNTARLINTIKFRSVVVEDFLKGLLGLPNVGNGLGLDLFSVRIFMFKVMVTY